MTSLGRQKLIMYNASNPRGPTISSLISSPNLSPSSSTTSSNQSLMPPVTPLSPTALKISRECKLFEQHFPGADQHDRMILLGWFLEEESLKVYDNFRKEFYEEPDEYNYALSSLLGTFVWDVSNSSSPLGTFIAPNIARRNQLLPWQALLTEKWKVFQSPFSYSWQHVLGKTQRESLIMKSFIDTANLDEQMALSRRQAFDLRTSELSGRGFLSFIQEHCLTTQSSGIQQGMPAISLPQTENMSRVFKDWIEFSNVPTPMDDGKEDHLFRKSCALSLRDKCIYSRALFGTRLCLVVLDKWEQIIRAEEAKSQIKSIPHSDRIEYNTAEIPQPTHTSAVPKTKKKKKSKGAKKTKKVNPVTTTHASEMPTEALQQEHRPVPDDANLSDDETVASGTDSSGLSSPLGTSSDGINSSSGTQPESQRRSVPFEFGINSVVTLDGKSDLEIASDMESAGEDTTGEPLGNLTNGLRRTSQAPPNGSVIPLNDADMIGGEVLASPNNQVTEQLAQETDSEWSPVTRRRRTANHDGNRRGLAGQQFATKRPQAVYTDNANGRYSSHSGQNTPRWQRLNGTPNPAKGGATSEQSSTRDEKRSQQVPVDKSQLNQALLASKLEGSVNGGTKNGEQAPPSTAPIELSRSTQTPRSPSPALRLSSAVTESTTATSSIHGTINKGEKQNLEMQHSRKSSVAGSETTDLSTTSSRAQKKTKKRKAKAAKRGAEAEPGQENELTEGVCDVAVIEKDSRIEPPRPPLALENIVFSCAYCRRPRTYHSARQCSLCGPNSTIRYCSSNCQKEDKDHWRLCGLSSFSIPTVIPEDPKNMESPRPQTPWMSAALVRQATLLADNTAAGYLLFDKGSNNVLYKLIFGDTETAKRFAQIRQRAFQFQDKKAITLMYKVAKSHVEKLGLRFSSEDLANQLFDEFGVHLDISPTQKESPVSPKEWFEAGVKLED